MSSPFLKSLVAIGFIITGGVAMLAMLTLMGKPDKSLSVGLLKRIHKTFGYGFVLLTLLITYFCIGYVRSVGEELSGRALAHAIFSLGVLVVLFLKILIVRVYKNFLRFAPVLGLLLFSLAFLVFSSSAGYFFVTELGRSGTRAGKPSDKEISILSKEADLQHGKELFEKNCSFCHYSDSEETKFGPGLAGILRKEKLPVSGKAANQDNIRNQLKNPFRSMPSFESKLSEQEIVDLLSFLASL